MPDPKKPAEPLSSLVDRLSDTHGETDPMYGSAILPYDQDKYRFQLKSNADNNKLRAQDQGFMETLGLKAANFLPNVVLGIGEMIGYAGALATEWGSERDYSNGLTKLMQDLKNPVGEIYRENPDQVVDFSDSAWWIDNIGGLLESATQFALPAAGLGSAFKGAALLAASGMGRTGLAVAKGAAQVATAGSLAYAEGAMSGYRVFERAYDEQYRRHIINGLDPQQAHKLASERAADAASTTVQLNTIMNTMLNMTALVPMFRGSQQRVTDFMRTEARILPGESADAFKARLLSRAEQAGIFKNRQGLISYPSEAFQEGLEEINTQYAEEEGQRVGEGKKKDLWKALTSIDQALGDVMNVEGALNFALGAFGGVAQTALLDNIPMHKGADGKLVSSRTLGTQYERKYYESVQDAIAEDFETFEKRSKELQSLSRKNDTESRQKAEELRMRMFDTLALNAVSMGMGEAWIETFKELGQVSNTPNTDELNRQLKELNATQTIDPDEQAALQEEKKALLSRIAEQRTDAMDRGLAVSPTDTTYQARARQAVEDIKYYQKIYDDISSRYNTDEEKALGVPDFLFLQKANLYRKERFLNEGRQLLEEEKATHARTKASIPELSEKVFERSVASYADQVRLDQSSLARVEADANKWNSAVKNKDQAAIQKLLDKYHIIGHTPAEYSAAMQRILDRLQKHHTDRLAAAKKQLETSIAFEDWKAAGNEGDLKDYIEYLGEAYGTSQALLDQEGRLDKLAVEIDEGRKNLDRLMNDEDGVRALIAKLEPEIAARNKAFQEKRMQDETMNEARASAAKTRVEVTEQHVDAMVQELEDKLLQLEDELTEVEQKIRKEERIIADHRAAQHAIWSLSQAKYIAARVRLERLNSRKASLERQIKDLRARIEKLKLDLALGRTPTVDAEPDSGTTATDESTGQPTGGEAQTENEGEVPEEVLVDPPSPLANALAKYTGLLMTLPAELQQEVSNWEPEAKKGVRGSASEMMQAPAVKQAADEGKFNVAIQYPRLNQVLDAQLAWTSLLPKVEEDEVTTEEEVIEEQGDPVPENTTEEPVKKKRGRPKGSKNKSKDGTTTKGTRKKKDKPNPPLPPAPVVTDHETTNLEGNGNLLEHVGRKTAHGGDKIQAPTFESEDYMRNDGNYGIMRTKLNPNLHPGVVLPNQLMPGTRVIIELATDYSGQVRVPGVPNETRTVTYSDYLDKKGKIADVDNVPIRVTDSNGRVIGFLPTVEWMLDKYPGTSNTKEGYRNHVFVHYYTQKDGTVITVPVLQIELDALRKVRETLAKTGMVETTILEKGEGVPILNMTADGAIPGKAINAANPEESYLPGYKSLKLGIVQNGTVQTSQKKAAPVQVAGDLEGMNNVPVVLVPAANGKLLAEPLSLPGLGEAASLATIEQAIILHFQAGQAKANVLIDELERQTGFDISTPVGLRGFIEQQYTYTSSFTEANLAYNPDKPERFLFNITSPTDSKATIMIGMENSGQPPMYARVSKGELNEEFREALRKGMATRSRIVNFSRDANPGINSAEPYTFAHWNGTGWSFNTYESYNEYILKHSTIYLDGRNQVNGQYIYTANPLLRYDSGNLKPVKQPTDAVPIAVVPEQSTVAPVEAAPEVPTEMESAVDDIPFFMDGSSLDMYTPTIQTTFEPGPTMQPISLAMLQELATFTPPGNRNDLTPEEVYNDLVARKIPYLAEGHNPFRKCQ